MPSVSGRTANDRARLGRASMIGVGVGTTPTGNPMTTVIPEPGCEVGLAERCGRARTSMPRCRRGSTRGDR